MSAADELVEWVDPHGHVLEIVSRRLMRDEGLRHRCTYVVLLPTPGEIVAHKRADWKDAFGGYWDVAFGGVCGVGEAWEDSARRELAEEAGIEVGADALVDRGPVFYDGPVEVVGRLYHVYSDQRPYSADGEAVAFESVAIADLDRWMESRLICPDTAAIVPPSVRRPGR